MYPQMDKNAGLAPTAPPSYSESINGPPMYNGSVPQYQPPPPQYAQQPNQQQPAQVIVVQATPPIPPLGQRSVNVTCPSCKSLVMSTVEETTSSKAYICCMLMCIFGMCACSYLPFCMDSFMNYKHTCPRCKAFFGVYQP
ncbi:lipopolysaccharide-induced tumor necrosis factor-alpha factor homolog [Sipha flava]|uniref:Lipopolysaccharide-induced tumor necrosis factor-alpha factor homolog n=1 Tax=Sipha flava TaxID=143950 RepID=A0A8B8G3P4_9HEMI|nr:lipopolysaccharide-induced tumor necrosis factor-alpha factor homolog [Sipha flava]